jgi:hypothetical protein
MRNGTQATYLTLYLHITVWRPIRPAHWHNVSIFEWRSKGLPFGEIMPWNLTGRIKKCQSNNAVFLSFDCEEKRRAQCRYLTLNHAIYQRVWTHSGNPSSDHFCIRVSFPATAKSLVFALLHVSATDYSHHQGAIYYKDTSSASHVQ